MAKTAISLLTLLSLMYAAPALAQDGGMGMGMDHAMMTDHAGMQGMMGKQDSRQSLDMPEPMRRMQLAMMRDHLKAVNEIVGLIAAGQFDKASAVAHTRLGLTPRMKRMCSMFGNHAFQAMGIAFHKSADHLAQVLKTRDTQTSLHALHSTMQYCVACHATYRQ